MKKFQSILIILFVLFSGAFGHSAILLDRVVAVVNQEVITWSDLYKAMEFETSDKLQGLKDEEKRRIFRENEGSFLEGLIDMKVQLQAAKQAGIEVLPEDVNDAINDIKKKYSMDEAALIESLRKEGFTFDEYKKKLAEQIALSRIVSQQIRNKVVVPEADIDKFLAENKGAAAIGGEGYRLRQIFFKKPASSEDKKTVEDKANEVLKQLKDGGDFAELSKKYSEDSSRKAGGDLGFIKTSQMAKDLLNILSGMKAGDVSQPFWTERGLHIIKLEEKSEKQTDSELRETVKNKLLEKQFSEKYRNWVRGLRENAYIEIRL